MMKLWPARSYFNFKIQLRRCHNFLNCLAQSPYIATTGMMQLPFNYDYSTHKSNKQILKEQIPETATVVKASLADGRYLSFTGKKLSLNNNTQALKKILDPEMIPEAIDSVESFHNIEREESQKTEASFKARNNRYPKQANHGARPCSSIMRRLRMKKAVNKGKVKTKDEE